ncbi:Sickle tail [Liparis tanakae]|uniref:Sickle tail n=1 Tax=Liparis tanakae TaxID=230148 RepID=A0A4Z2EIF7_9TELE|nr:Sickle tail [Liparis tanakae]
MPEPVGPASLEALLVASFPQLLSLKMLQSPNMAVYIKEPDRNVYYDLQDVRNIPSHSCVKVYHRDAPRHGRPAATQPRVSQETGDRRQETGDRRQETRDKRQETGDRRQETGDRRQETRDKRQETGDRRQETGDKRQETRDKRQETGDRRRVVGCLSII